MVVTRYEVGGCAAVGRIGVDGLWTMMTMGKEGRVASERGGDGV